MQGLGTTFFASTVAAASFFSNFLVTMVDKVTRKAWGKSWIGNFLVTAFNLTAFLWASRRYIHKEEKTEANENESYDDMKIEEHGSLNLKCKYELQAGKA